jgi:hypothetical protein
MNYLCCILYSVAGSIFLLSSSSCCNRPYSAGGTSWTQKDKNPEGPYDFDVWSYKTQTGWCPKSHDKGAKITISIWDFNHQNKLFRDTFETDLYFDDVSVDFSKDGSVIVVDDTSKKIIRRYSRIAERQWQYQQ